MTTIVTAENIDIVRECVAAVDQSLELVVGCETWTITYDGGQRGQMTVWPDAGRGAVCWGGDSAWGDWDPITRTLRLDTGELVDSAGETIERRTA